MPSPLRLEVFEAHVPDGSTVTLRTDALEEARLAAFEQGYKAGWDDAAKAAGEEQTRLRADLARNLQALSFTYEEAHRHVLAALGPMLQEMAAVVLPKLARDTLGAAVAEALMPIAERAGRPPVTLLVSPASRAMVEAALKDAVAPPLEIREESTLGTAQALLRFDGQELRIDLDGALAKIAAATAAFLGTGAMGAVPVANTTSGSEMTDGRAIA
jgi:hypothetical protein